MYRYYNEDWERRKSYLIRSLFHDIPYRVLSPVPEETIQSPPSAVDAQSPKSSSTPHPKESASLYEPQTPSGESSEFDKETHVNRLGGQVERSYSPLPPLIIERELNKHDDPPEYYQKLLQKIKKIYRKLFIEGKNLSDDDYFMSDNDSIMIEDVNKDIREVLSDVTQSSSFSSDYSADVEFSDVDDDKDSKLAGLYQINQMDEGIEFNVEQEHNMDVIQDYFDDNNETNVAMGEEINVAMGDERNVVMGDERNVGMGDERSASIEEADYRQITTHAEVHFDGTSPTRARPSPVYEMQQVELTPSPAMPTLARNPASEERSSSTPTHMDLSFENTPVLIYQESGDETSSSDIENPNANVTKELPNTEKPNSSSPPKESLKKPIHDQALPEEAQIQEYESSPRSPSLTKSQGVSSVLGSLEERTSKEASMDSDDDKHEQISEPVRDASHAEVGDVTKTSMVLRFRKSGVSLGRERELAMMEYDEDPDTTPSTAETSNLRNDTPEIMRTPRTGASTESNQINISRQTSDMDLTCVQDTALQNITNLTLTPQHNNNSKEMAETTKLDDIEDILKSIFAETSSENSSKLLKNDAEKKKGFGRKRSYEEMSVQTENFTWHDLRSDFFVGTPKVFRLCSCVGHVCQ